MSRRRNVGVALVAAACAAHALVGCGADSPKPLAPPPPPPGIAELHPPPGATRQPFDVAPWVRFESPLDPATVTTKTVFLLLDTRRIRTEVRWEPTTNRIVIEPLEELTLARTHTVQLSTAIRGADGVPLAAPYEWQFRVTGVRSPDPVYPVPGATFESPFASPDWAATESSAGDLRYTFYAGPDSASVAARTVAPLSEHAYPLYLPVAPWPVGGRVWWTVTTENRTVDERIDGPVSHFDVLPAGTPVDSIGSPFTRWGWAFVADTASCRQALWVGNGFVSGIVWSPDQFGGPRKLARAWLDCASSNSSAVPRVWGADRVFNECGMSAPGPPFVDPAMPVLAPAVRPAGSTRLRFESDALTARLERAQRGASPPALLFTSGLLTNLKPLADVAPSLRLYYYVLPPSGPAPVASPNSVRRPTRR